MANIKISDLTSAAAATGTQQFEVNESGTSKKVTGAQLATYIEGEISSSPSFTGQVSVDAGSASAPSITKTGDSNTGIYFPAADTIALSTGGTYRLIVDSSGNTSLVGGLTSGAITTGNITSTGTIELGHASDTTLSRSAAGVIAVEGGVVPKENRANTFTAAQTIATGASQALLTLDANAAVSKTILMTTAASNRWIISSENTAESGSNAGSNFIINRYNDAGAFLSTALTINRATGNVGIGTTPGQKLDVIGTIRSSSTVGVGDSSVNLSGTIVNESDTSKSISITADPGGVGANSFVGFKVDGTERMRIDASGNVGIGTSSISTKLHVDSGGLDEVARLNSSGNTYLSWYRSNVREAYIQATSALFVIWGEQAKPLVLATNNSERLRVDASGNVLVTGAGGLGYGTGSGGTVTQATSKLTGVTINKTNGQITTANSSIIANGGATFTVTNSTVAATDNIIVTRASGGTGNRYTIQVSAVAAGSFDITILNNSAASQSDVIVINFAVIKATTS